MPFFFNETFGVTIKNSQFIFDWATVGCAGPNWNSNEHYLVDNSTFTIVNGSPGGGSSNQCGAWELTQRNSGFGTWTNDTFDVAVSYGTAEWIHDILFDHNTVHCHPYATLDSHSQDCWNMDGQNITITNNSFDTTGDWNTSSGAFAMIADRGDAPGNYYQYMGNLTYSGNTITCRATGNPCVSLAGTYNANFNNNTVQVTSGNSSGYGILLQYFDAIGSVNGNTVKVQGGNGIYLLQPANNGWQTNGNNVSTAASGSGTGILVTNTGSGSSCQMQNNNVNVSVTGYTGTFATKYSPSATTVPPCSPVTNNN
jgi:hypothetical protein